MYHYDASNQCRGKCDASHKGLGAALELKLERDKWVSIALTPRLLHTAEQNIAQTSWNCSQSFNNANVSETISWATNFKFEPQSECSNRRKWAERMLPFENSIFHITGALIRMASYLSRIHKFEAPPTSIYDEHFLVKAIENLDE